MRRRTSQSLEARRLRFARKQKRKARNLVNNALADGKLERENCKRCGSAFDIEAHHEDYSKPLDVTWLCVDCHNARHEELAALGIDPDVPGLWPEGRTA